MKLQFNLLLLGTEIIVADLKRAALACRPKRLKMTVSTPASWPAHALGIRPAASSCRLQKVALVVAFVGAEVFLYTAGIVTMASLCNCIHLRVPELKKRITYLCSH